MKDSYQSRSYSVAAIIICLAIILIGRLFYVQIVASEYKQFAEENTRTRRVVHPARGLILDRNGNVLVNNETIYDLMVIPRSVEPFDTAHFCELLDVDIQFVRKRFAELYAKRRYFVESVFLKQLSQKQFGAFQERMYQFRGFFPKARTVRHFPHKTAPLVLGYLGEVDDKVIAQSDGYYGLGDYHGKSGLEKSYEDLLKGKKGIEFLVVDKYNRLQGSYQEGAFDKNATSGTNITTTLDLDLQRYGERLMQNKVGAIVAIEPSTGEILAMVSAPHYNPNEIVGRGRRDYFAKLSADTNKPLFNRAISAMYPPGSIFKPLMAAVGLQEGVISPSTRFPCRMGYTIPGLHVGCHAHKNNLNLHESIAQSCNAYYCHVFRNVIDQDKFDDTESGFVAWRNYMEAYGFGHTLGLDLPNEKMGILPTVEKFDGIYGEGRWRSSYIISLAIGQAEISLTPVQMANSMAIVANKGYYYDPHLVKDPITSSIERHTVPIDPRNFSIVKDGMEEVFKTGTARWYKLDSIVQCGKTGTAENPHGEDHSNFVAFAPKENPKIAIAVVVENGGFGSTWAAPIASLMMEQYLTDTITRDWIEKRILEKDFIHKADSLVTDSFE